MDKIKQPQHASLNTQKKNVNIPDFRFAFHIPRSHIKKT